MLRQDLAHGLVPAEHRNEPRGGGELCGEQAVVSEEIEALDGLADEDRRTLALHALVADAPSAWLRGRLPDSQRAVERAGKLAAGVEAAVREAAGLDAVLDEEQAELLRFVTRMATATERRDLLEPGSGSGPGSAGGAGVAFPPLKRRIRPLPPDKAAEAWLARFRALAGLEDERRRRIAAIAGPDRSDPGTGPGQVAGDG